MLSNLPLDQPFSTQWNNVFIWTRRAGHISESVLCRVYILQENRTDQIFGIRLAFAVPQENSTSVCGDYTISWKIWFFFMQLCDTHTWINHHFE